MYNSDYFTNSAKEHNAIGYVDYADQIAAQTVDAQLNLLEEVRTLKRARVLDVGCATGEILAEAQRRGADVVGVDVSEWAAETARRRHGIRVMVGTLESFGEVLGKFDVILALEVIEHVESPRAFLRQLSGRLTSGGHAMISTPNYRCARRLGERWRGFQSSFEHLYFFSDEVLSRMAGVAGLRELAWYTDGHGVAPRFIEPTPWVEMKRLLGKK